MKYTFIAESGQQKTVEIDDAWINKQVRLLGISKREAIEMWLSDEGYISNEVVEELTSKAKTNGVKIKGSSTKPRKKPERKPDYVKRTIVDWLFNTLAFNSYEHEGVKIEPREVEVTNIERMIAFSVGDDNFELTLSKKRKPKT